MTIYTFRNMMLPSSSPMEMLMNAGPRAATRRRGPALLASCVAGVVGCNAGSGAANEAAANRGRVVWMARCTSCHHMDPLESGALGPAVAGASRELLEARVLRAGYPVGYIPKRTTTLMQPLPDLANSIDDLAAFLASTEGTR